MKRHLRNSWNDMHGSNKPQATSNSRTILRMLRVACGLSLVAVVGCESLQRKFTRKPSQSHPLSPIIQFEDYTRSMTPLDRYRKHLMLFDYWNNDLTESLQGSSCNAKRLRRASSESLLELQTLQGLLTDEAATRLTQLLEERAAINQQIQQGTVEPFQANVVVRTLEAQTRQMHRDFYWRKVEDRLKPLDDARTH